MTSTLERRAGTEVITCYGFGTKVNIPFFRSKLSDLIVYFALFLRSIVHPPYP